MIREILDININETLEESLKTIIDNYVLPSNTVLYMLITDSTINLYKSPETTLFKNSEIQIPTLETLKKIKAFDFYSRVEDTNKALSKKKDILSNNIYSLIIQKQSLFNQEIFQDHYEEYTNKIFSYIKGITNDKKTNALLNEYNQISGNILSEESFIECKRLYLNNISNFLDTINQHDIKLIKPDDKIAIFIDTTLENYQKEYLRYLYAKIFISNEYNYQTFEKIYGIPNFNNNFNSKTPFIIKTTRTNKNMRPLAFLVDDAIKLQTNFKLCNINNKYIEDVFIEKSPEDADEVKEELNDFGYYIQTETTKKGKVIRDFDVIPHVIDKNINLTIKNFLQVEKIEPKIIYKQSQLHKEIDKIWFNSKLIKNYFTDKLEQTNNKQLDAILMTYKNTFKNCFILNNKEPLKRQLDIISKKILIAKLCKNDYLPYSEFNLRLSLLEYFRIGGYENMETRTDSVFQNVYNYAINEQDISLNDDEFYFLIGQTIKYLFSQSESQKIQYNKYFDCIDKKDIKQIKEQLNLLFKKYAHKISTKNFRFNNMYSFILSYEPQSKKVDLDMLLLGFMYSSNIYFIKSEKEDKSTDNVDEK